MRSAAPTVRIRPVISKAGPRRLLDLTWALVVREIKGQYRRSLLGPFWAILQPLFYMLIFTFIRSVLSISSEGMPYVIFTYSALVPWTFFSNAVSRCGPSVYSNAPIVKKSSFPREIFPASMVAARLVDFGASFLILVGMMIWFRVPVEWSLLWLPVLVILTTLLALGLGLGVAAIGTFKRDTAFALPFVMQFWLLLTPTMYPLSNVPQRMQFIYRLNPMVGIIEGFRDVIVKGVAPDLHLLAISLIGIVVVWVVTWPFFRSVSRYFADVL